MEGVNLVSRRSWLLAACVLPACTSRHREGPAFPRYAGNWTLQSGPQDTEGASGAEAAWVAIYAGQPNIRVTLQRMPSQTGAFAKVQEWRPAAGKLAFYKGPYFGIVEADGADHPTMNRFATAFQGSLPDR